MKGKEVTLRGRWGRRDRWSAHGPQNSDELLQSGSHGAGTWKMKGARVSIKL